MQYGHTGNQIRHVVSSTTRPEAITSDGRTPNQTQVTTVTEQAIIFGVQWHVISNGKEKVRQTLLSNTHEQSSEWYLRYVGAYSTQSRTPHSRNRTKDTMHHFAHMSHELKYGYRTLIPCSVLRVVVHGVGSFTTPVRPTISLQT